LCRLSEGFSSPNGNNFQYNYSLQIINDENFPDKPILAIRNGFAEAERRYLDFAINQ
jgi:hypothetical protein